MKWSVQIGSVKGIQVRVHVTFVLIVVWGAINYGNGRGIEGLVYGAVMTLLLFGIVFLHELGHSLAALRYGIGVRDITLLPIGGVARLERMPQKPSQELIVAAAGPAVNVLLAILFLPLLWWASNGSLMAGLLYQSSAPGLKAIIRFLYLVNASLLIFNLIPAFPLDGGRILRAFLALWLGNVRATRIAVWAGKLFAVLLGFYGIWTGNWVMAFIALFIFTVGSAEGRSVMVQDVLAKVSVRQMLSESDVIFQPDLPIVEAASLALHSRQANFPVVSNGLLVGIIRRYDIHQALRANKKWFYVADFMQRDVPQLEIDSSLSDLQEELAQSKTTVAAIYEDSQFRGVIGFEEIERALYLFKTGGQSPSPAM